MSLALVRVAPGRYRTKDGGFEVVRGEAGSWAGQWVYRSASDKRDVSDPMRTLTIARGALEARLIAEDGTR